MHAHTYYKKQYQVTRHAPGFKIRTAMHHCCTDMPTYQSIDRRSELLA